MEHESEAFARGLACLQRGDLAGAEAACAEVLGKNPHESGAWNLKAIIARQRASWEEAIQFHQNAIAAKPESARYHFDLGESLHAAGKRSEAVDAYRRAAALRPRQAEIHFNLGRTLFELGATGPAIAALQEATRLRPADPAYHDELGMVLAKAKRWKEAVAAFEEALRWKEDYGDAWSNLGAALVEMGKIDEALSAHRKARLLQPDAATVHNNLAIALHKAGDLESSLAEFRQAIALCPDMATGWANVANVLNDLGRIDEAMAGYRRAIGLKVDLAEAHRDLAMGLLQLGDYESGFWELEWRKKTPDIQARQFAGPRWTGEDPRGRTIMVCEEWGYGDVIHFARYMGVLAERGAKVMVGCRKELARLMARCEGVAQVVTEGQAVPPFDYHVALLSLAYFCGTKDQTSIPAKTPYIHVEEDLARSWKKRLAGERRLKVGLSWAGNSRHRNDRYRSLRLKQMEALAGAGDIAFHGVQVGGAAEQWKEVPTLAVEDHAAELRDFVDTAALIGQLDLVITIDSAVAHLAGALGKPVWILLASAPDWRWMLERSDSPWYPTARLFRQKWQGWEPVITEVAQELGRIGGRV